MNQYPEDHPLWQDINFCPDWLYRHIREPPGAAVNQRVPQQHTVPAEGETAPSASRERQLAEGAEPAWNPRPAERQQEQQQCPTPRHDHQHPGTQHGHRPGSYGGGANVQPGGLEMALSREQFQQLYGAGGARTVPPAAQQHAEPQMHFQGSYLPTTINDPNSYHHE